jgi:hypothetical protein
MASFRSAKLSGASVAQTTGTGPTAQITLDTNAAGYGWFIDYTPYLNEEWLPTSNPHEWQAKPGSDAEGKMDMLSVLLHEYGHVLGRQRRFRRDPAAPPLARVQRPQPPCRDPWPPGCNQKWRKNAG